MTPVVAKVGKEEDEEQRGSGKKYDDDIYQLKTVKEDIQRYIHYDQTTNTVVTIH